MQKLKNSILARMIEEKLTGSEIDLLLYVSFYQDEDGRTSGVHYKKVCETVGMSFQTFYDAKRALEEKGIISCEKTDRTDHDITIQGNRNADCLREGYLNTNHSIFFSKEFQKLKAGSKLLALELMKLTYAGKGHTEKAVEAFYRKYTGLFRVSRRVMRSYLTGLKGFFFISIKNRKYYITPKKSLYKRPGTKGEAERFREHGVEAIVRRNRLQDTVRDSREIETLFRQYGRAAGEAGRDIFRLVNSAVRKSLETTAGKTKKGRSLNPVRTRELLKDELAAAKNISGDRKRRTYEENGNRSGGRNRFLNFHQREYDYDELERIFLNTEPQPSHR